MADTTSNLDLPYILAAQSQKHVTHNEALTMLDAIVQLAVASRLLASPPGSPIAGVRYIVASGASGAWAGWAGSVVMWQDGAWLRLVPEVGWRAWVVAEGLLVCWNGSAWVNAFAGGPITLSDSDFSLADNGDPTKLMKFELSGIATGTTRTLTVPNINGEIVVGAGSQTIAGTKTFTSNSGAFGSGTGSGTIGIASGATASGNTQVVDIGTAGVSGSTTNISIGSAVAGAAGTLNINSPSVVFGSTVSTIAMSAANLSAKWVGIGGATADATNRLSINSPASLFNHAGTSHEVTINKNAAGNDASVAFKTGFSARALAGLLGDDNWRLKVSPNGSAWFDALVADRSTGQVTAPNGAVVTGSLTGTAVTQSATDATAGRVMKVGDAGVLGTVPILSSNSPSMRDRELKGGFYGYNTTGGPTGNPDAAFSWTHTLMVLRGSTTLTGVGERATYLSTRLTGTAASLKAWLGADSSTAGQINWTEIFTQRSILGTVSQSGGVPTGAVIERGSNANGDYVRFADGTQICWDSHVESALAVTTAAGALYRSGDIAAKTFPAVFVAAPEVVLSCHFVGVADGWMVTNGDPTTTATTNGYHRALVYQTRTADFYWNWVAFGRWF